MEPGVDVCLWQLSYSYMKLIVCYTSKELINQTKILETLKEKMECENFQQLMNLSLKKKKKFNILIAKMSFDISGNINVINCIHTVMLISFVVVG